MCDVISLFGVGECFWLAGEQGGGELRGCRLQREDLPEVGMGAASVYLFSEVVC